MFWIFIIIPIACYVILMLLLSIFQSRMVFLPGKTIFMTPDESGMTFEDLFIEVDSGVSINAWFIPAEDARGTVLFCHGNAGTMSHRIETAEIFHSLGLNFLIFDYCGYGRSTGLPPSETQTYRDAEAAWKYLVETRNIPPGKIVIVGRSMGGPVAAKLAKEHHPALCILESTFTSIPDMARSRFPFFPTKWLVSIKYPTIDYLREIKIPLLIVHSRDDEIIPYQMGKDLFASAKEPKYFSALNGGHNETYFECIAEYRGQLETAIGKHLL